MAEKHDFQDGNGPVAAHKHPNGGGWVVDTARVDATAYVGADARVYGGARVCGGAEVFGSALVFGSAWVYGSAEVCGGAWDESPPYAQIGRWAAWMPSHTAIRIGCQEAPLADWTPERVTELAKQHSATPREIAGAISFVLWCRAVAAGVGG